MSCACLSLAERRVEPLIAPPDNGPEGGDIAFAASLIDEEGVISLCYPRAAILPRRATIRRRRPSVPAAAEQITGRILERFFDDRMIPGLVQELLD